LFGDTGFAPPTDVRACVIGVDCGSLPNASSTPLHRTYVQWRGPNAGNPTSYTVLRTDGSTFIDNQAGTGSGTVGTNPDKSKFMVDTEEFANTSQHTYAVKANFTGGSSDKNDVPVTITASNVAPVAVADGPLTVFWNTQTVLNVLGNDTDAD